MAGMLGTIDALYQGWKFKRSPLGQALALHTQQYFYSGQALSWLSKPNKEKFIQDFYAKLVAIRSEENPPMALREALAEYAILFSKLAMLCLTEHEKAGQFYSANPYITGELHRRNLELAGQIEEAAQFLWQTPDATAEDLKAFANTRSALMLYYANGLNIARIAIGDTDPAKDWFQPFVESLLVWEEDSMREQLGLPRLLSGPMYSLPYTTFLNYVVEGERNPFFTWAQAWPDHYLAGDGPRP